MNKVATTYTLTAKRSDTTSPWERNHVALCLDLIIREWLLEATRSYSYLCWYL